MPSWTPPAGSSSLGSWMIRFSVLITSAGFGATQAAQLRGEPLPVFFSAMIAILSGRVPEQRKVPLTWENVGVEANILL